MMLLTLMKLTRAGALASMFLLGGTAFAKDKAWSPSLAPEQVRFAAKHGVPTHLEPIPGYRFVLIPPGSFTMGRKPSPDHPPLHPAIREDPRVVSISQVFYLQVAEVTNKQFSSFEPKHTSAPLRRSSEPAMRKLVDTSAPRLPVTQVSHTQAEAFVRWLSTRCEAGSFRLPSEAQWEYAARAGLVGRTPWKRDSKACRHANVKDSAHEKVLKDAMDRFPCDDSYPGLAPVGLFRANRWGLHDTLGNVWEWCRDWIGPYDDLPRRDPLRLKADERFKSRAIRGGAFDVGKTGTQFGFRNWLPPAMYLHNVGFRMVFVRRSVAK